MASNVAVETDAAGNLKPSKNKSTERIDDIVAMVMALGRLMVRSVGTAVARGIQAVHSPSRSDCVHFSQAGSICGSIHKAEIGGKAGSITVAIMGLARLIWKRDSLKSSRNGS